LAKLTKAMSLVEHRKRLITGFAILFGSAALYYALGQVAVYILTTLIALGAYYELLTMLLDQRLLKQYRPFVLAFSVLVALCFLLSRFYYPEAALLPVYFAVLAFLIFAFILGHFGKGSETAADGLEIHLRNAVAQTFGLIYIVTFLSFGPMIHAMKSGPLLFIFLLLIISFGDIGAYYGGKTFGHTPLSPNISPKKTWEGTFSGTLLCLLIGWAYHHFLLPELSLPTLLATTLITSIIAQLGDLVESTIKRVAHVKDSGQLLPGHGGVFDRFDSLILAAPVYYFLLHFLV
jgi:phosphatidate cytidylyltransferase